MEQSNQKFKSVMYFGIKLLVPMWTNYIATDYDGEITAFSDKPIIGKCCFHPASGTLCGYVKGSKEIGNWRKSVMRIKK